MVVLGNYYNNLLVTKISQDAKERMTAGNNQYTERPTVQGREGKTETGETTEILAEIAGTGKGTIERVLRVQKQGVPDDE